MTSTEQLLALRTKRGAMTIEEATAGYHLRPDQAMVDTLVHPTLEPIPHVSFAIPERMLDHVTPDEINALYDCDSASRFLQLVDAMKAKRRGSWPIPGWHTYMIHRGVMAIKHEQFKHQPDYDTWVQVCYTPQPGSCYYQAQDNLKKALRDCIYCPGITCHCKEPVHETEEPRKKRRQACTEDDYEITPWQEMEED